jgi:hypothetical protein
MAGPDLIARGVRRSICACACALALGTLATSEPAAAQTDRLQKFHVKAFELAGDPLAVKVGEPVRLTLRIRLAERVQALDRVTLPNLGGFDSYGDERHCVPAGRGSECTELLTVRGTAAGTYTLGPAVFEAIDAATGKPSRFESNAVAVTVAPRSVTYGSHLPFYALLAVLAAALAGAVAFARRMRSRPTAGTVSRLEPDVIEAPPAAALPVTSGVPLDEERWRSMIANLEAQPSRARVLIVRTALRERLGVHDDETFGDVMARYAATCDGELLDALRAIERAAFIDDAHLEDAVRDAHGPLERFVRSSSPYLH